MSIESAMSALSLVSLTVMTAGEDNIVNEEDEAHPHALSVGEEVVVDDDGGNGGGERREVRVDVETEL